MTNQLPKCSMLPVGTEVYFNGIRGVVQFKCESYITVCIKTYDHPSRDVCVLIYDGQMDKLQLVHGNRKGDD